MAVALAGAPEITVREPPFSLQAERATLGAVLLEPPLFAEVNAKLLVDDFFLPVHREIWSAMLAIDRREQPIDVLLVADELKAMGMLSRLEGGEIYLVKLAGECPVLGNLGHYLGIVTANATARKLIAACAEAMSRAYGGATEADELLDDHAGAIMKIAQRSARDLRSITPVVEESMDIFEKRQIAKNPVTGVATGIDMLDRFTGGFQPGNHVVVAARPGVGKTAFALNVVLRHVLTRGGTALIFSLEMTESEVVERLFCIKGGVDSELLRRGEISPLAWNDLNRAEAALAPAPIYIVDDQSNISQMEATARRYAARHPEKLGLIVIDYIQLAEVVLGRGQTLSQGLGEVSKRIKRLAKKLRVPIIDVSQLNRDSEKEKRQPRISDLRATGDLEQDADIIIFPDNPEMTKDGEVDIILAKNRNGRTGFMKSRWVGKFYSFYDTAPDWQQGGAE